MERSVCYVEKRDNNGKTQNTQNINKKEGGGGGWAKQKDDQKQQFQNSQYVLSTFRLTQVYNYQKNLMQAMISDLG